MANDEPSMHHWFQMSTQFLMLSISFVAGVQTQQASEPKAHQQPELTLNAGQQIADAEVKSVAGCCKTAEVYITMPCTLV